MKFAVIVFLALFPATLFANFEERFSSEITQSTLIDDIPSTQITFQDAQGELHRFLVPSPPLTQVPYFNRQFELGETSLFTEGENLTVFKKIIYFLYKKQISFDESFSLNDLLKLQFVWHVPGLSEEVIRYVSRNDFRTETDSRELANILFLGRQFNQPDLENALFRQIYFRNYIYQLSPQPLLRRLKDHPRLAQDLISFLNDPPSDVLKERNQYNINVQNALKSKQLQMNVHVQRSKEKQNKLMADRKVKQTQMKLETFLTQMNDFDLSNSNLILPLLTNEEVRTNSDSKRGQQILQDVLIQMETLFPDYGFEIIKSEKGRFTKENPFKYQLKINLSPNR